MKEKLYLEGSPRKYDSCFVKFSKITDEARTLLVKEGYELEYNYDSPKNKLCYLTSNSTGKLCA